MPNKTLFTLFSSGLLLLAVAVQGASDSLMIADFNQGNQNALGGYFNNFEREPSTATVDITNSVFRGNTGKSLEIKAKKDQHGFCGVWMHLFDFRADDKVYLDASAYSYLSFWVKGEKGGEKFAVRVADKRLVTIEDSLNVGDITKFLPNGVNQEWQEVVVPINRLRNVDINQLGGITFDFGSPGNHTIFIDDIAFKKSKDTLVAPTHSTSETASAKHQTSPPKALWVWTVFDILKNKNNEQNTLFELCERENVDRLWLQVPARYEPEIDLSADVKGIQPAEFKVTLKHEKKLRAFIRKAHARGIKVEALDGYPEFAQKPYHFIPLAIVDSIIDYNKRVKPEERFDGVHFDNEPYLIIGWHDKKRREQILREFLELNVECQRRIHENSDMIYGIDIPFWWTTPDPFGEGAIADVTFNGERKSAEYFCIDLLDNVGIMNYRDTTYGADGIIAHANPILKYAEKAGKDQIYIGLEVFRYMPTDVLFSIGIPRDVFHNALQSNANKFSYLSRINGFRTQTINDGEYIHVGIELPANPDESMQKKINETIIDMSRHLGINSIPGLDSRDQKKATRRIQNEIKKDPEWADYEYVSIIDPQTLQENPGFKAVRIMLSKTTFADESYNEFKSQLEAADSELIHYQAYAGIALHYFKVLNEKFYEGRAKERTFVTEGQKRSPSIKRINRSSQNRLTRTRSAHRPIMDGL
ncbi:MAG: hypothetical protein ACI9ZV_000440 [Candidatus Azotimanducaceae bacterium]|jgi:hypothetical protein